MLMVLIAGPVRGGTGDDPVLIESNIQAMTEPALALYRKGHLPVVGEWFSIPLIEAAGSIRVGDEIYDEIQHPLAEKLLIKCDGCLRVGGTSAGADHMVATTLELGKPVWYDIIDIPAA